MKILKLWNRRHLAQSDIRMILVSDTNWQFVFEQEILFGLVVGFPVVNGLI